MKLSYFISKRINEGGGNYFSATIQKIAIASISIGLAIMIVSFLILGGFKETISNKIVSFGSHLQITKFSMQTSIEEDPISLDKEIFNRIKEFPFIEHTQAYAHKVGLLKTENEVYGVILKGVGPDYDSTRFSQNLEAGRMPVFNDSTYSREVVISRFIANALELKLNDQVIIFFPQDPPRYRQLDVVGIYYTGMEDFDQKIVLGDIGLIRRINNWEDSLAGGVEVYLKDFDQLDKAEQELYEKIDFDLYVDKITDRYLEIFDWLRLINQNVYIFLTIILFVASFNMVSILLILIMERTGMIGILKAVGATNRQLRNIFISNGMLLIGKGLFWGNLIGIGFGLIQFYLKPFKLDPDSYYMEFVPIAWHWPTIFWLNLLIFTVVSLVLLIPTNIISRISPIRAIRFN